MKSTKQTGQIRQRLEEYLEECSDINQPVSMSQAARGIGVSVTAISQFISGKYPGDNGKLAEKVQSWLLRQVERQDYVEPLQQTIPTEAVTKIIQTARICHIQREIGVATGPAGAGKTRGCKLYAKKNPDVIFIEVLPYYTAKYLMSDIHQQSGYNGFGTLIDMANDVIDKLKGSGRMIIIDEAEHLPYKALELVRRLHDLTGVGLLLVGMPQLITNLKGSRGQFRQLYSRVAVNTLIADLDSEDVEKLVSAAIPNSNGVWKDFESHTNNARSLSKLLKMSMQIAKTNNSPVDADDIQSAREYIII